MLHRSFFRLAHSHEHLSSLKFLEWNGCSSLYMYPPDPSPPSSPPIPPKGPYNNGSSLENVGSRASPQDWCLSPLSPPSLPHTFLLQKAIFSRLNNFLHVCFFRLVFLFFYPIESSNWCRLSTLPCMDENPYSSVVFCNYIIVFSVHIKKW